jgi:histidine kinase/DNA gyrase B/HSP90-like ATPase
MDEDTLAARALAEEEATNVLIAVRDSGPGLNPKGLNRLFDAFYTTKPQGLGMGLAISRSIIEAPGGCLWAMANVPRGAVFQFTLPLGAERMSSDDGSRLPARAGFGLLIGWDPLSQSSSCLDQSKLEVFDLGA